MEPSLMFPGKSVSIPGGAGIAGTARILL